MGCFDKYCFICCNTTNSAKILEDYYHQNNEERIEQGKEPYNIKNIQNFVKKTLHLDICTFLTEGNEVIHDCCEINGCGTFSDKNGNLYGLLLHKDDNDSNIKYGIFLHTDCWKYIKNKSNIELRFSDIKSNIIDDLRNNLFAKIEYGDIIDKYIGGQYMDFEQLFEDKNLYLCYSPLKYNKKNNKRIDKIIEQILL